MFTINFQKNDGQIVYVIAHDKNGFWASRHLADAHKFETPADAWDIAHEFVTHFPTLIPQVGGSL